MGIISLIADARFVRCNSRFTTHSGHWQFHIGLLQFAKSVVRVSAAPISTSIDTFLPPITVRSNTELVIICGTKADTKDYQTENPLGNVQTSRYQLPLNFFFRYRACIAMADKLLAQIDKSHYANHSINHFLQQHSNVQ